MSKNDFILCSEMISAAFGSIEKSSLEKNNKFFNSWKKIITGISSYGQHLYEHTSIIDIKNGVLLLETDHSGWIQILQMNFHNLLLKFSFYPPNNLSILIIKVCYTSFSQKPSTK